MKLIYDDKEYEVETLQISYTYQGINKVTKTVTRKQLWQDLQGEWIDDDSLQVVVVRKYDKVTANVSSITINEYDEMVITCSNKTIVEGDDYNGN